MCFFNLIEHLDLVVMVILKFGTAVTLNDHLRVGTVHSFDFRFSYSRRDIQVRKEDRIRLLHPFHAIQKAGLPIRLSERPVLENSPDAVAGDRIGKPPTYIFPV